MLLACKAARLQSLAVLLRAGFSKSDQRLAQRLREKKLALELKELQERSISQTEKRLALRNKMKEEKKPVMPIPPGFRLGFTEEEMTKANPDVQAAFSFENGSEREWMKERRKAVTVEFGQNAQDTGNTAVQVACITEQVAFLAYHLKIHRNDVCAFIRMRKLLDRRTKLLKYLHRTNYYLYKTVIAKYSINDIPGDHHFTRMHRKQLKLG